MHTPPVTERLRSACVLLAAVEGHADAIAAWFARADDPDLPMTAAEAADNVRDLMEGYAEALVARSRMLAALDELSLSDRSPGGGAAAPETALRAALREVREALATGVGLLALEKSDLDRPLPRETDRLLVRADGCRGTLHEFFDTWRPPKPHGWPTDALGRVDRAAEALRAALDAAPPPGPTALALASAMDAFDEAFDDAAELVQAMLQLAQEADAAERVAAAWHCPGLVADDAARAQVGAPELARLLGQGDDLPLSRPPPEPRPGGA